NAGELRRHARDGRARFGDTPGFSCIFDIASGCRRGRSDAARPRPRRQRTDSAPRNSYAVGRMHQVTSPTPSQIRRWRRYLAAERAERDIYRDLAERRDGRERDILLGLAEAERRHEQHWLELLGEHQSPAPTPDARTRFLGFLAKRLGF